jgi:hypothetical protein
VLRRTEAVLCSVNFASYTILDEIFYKLNHTRTKPGSQLHINLVISLFKLLLDITGAFGESYEVHEEASHPSFCL